MEAGQTGQRRDESSRTPQGVASAVELLEPELVESVEEVDVVESLVEEVELVESAVDASDFDVESLVEAGAGSDAAAGCSALAVDWLLDWLVVVGGSDGVGSAALVLLVAVVVVGASVVGGGELVVEWVGGGVVVVDEEPLFVGVPVDELVPLEVPVLVLVEEPVLVEVPVLEPVGVPVPLDVGGRVVVPVPEEVDRVGVGAGVQPVP
jgi:hypothetical protein